jgi:ribosome recycling factor
MEIMEAKKKMEQTIDNMNDQVRGIHGSSIGSALIDIIKVAYHGSPTPIKHIATTVDLAQGISITPYESDMCGKIITALKAASLDAYQFSKATVMVNRPKPSGEDKTQVVKQMMKIGEDAKISIRQIRQAFRDHLNGPDDEVKSSNKIVDHYTKSACDLVDSSIRKRSASI